MQLHSVLEVGVNATIYVAGVSQSIVFMLILLVHTVYRLKYASN